MSNVDVTEQLKLDTERDVSTAGSGSKSGAGSQLHLQNALSRRQALLNQIRAEQSQEMTHRPRSYGGNYHRRHLSPLPSPRSLPDNQNIYSMPQRQIVEHVIRNDSVRQAAPAAAPSAPQQNGLYLQSLNPPQGASNPYPTIIQQLPAPQQHPQAIIQQIPPPAMPSNSKSDMMDMMMMQNAQMHSIIMQQMMLSSIPKQQGSFGGASVPLVAPVETSMPQIVSIGGGSSRRPPSVHHHHYSMPRPGAHMYQLPPLDTNRVPPPPTGPQEVEPLKAPNYGYY